MIGSKKRLWKLDPKYYHGNVPHSEQGTRDKKLSLSPTQAFVFQYQLSSTESQHWGSSSSAPDTLQQG